MLLDPGVLLLPGECWVKRTRRERFSAATARWRAKNPEAHRAYHQKWRLAKRALLQGRRSTEYSRKKAAERARTWRKKNQEHANACARERRCQKREHCLRVQAKWAAANPDRIAATRRRGYLKRRKNPSRWLAGTLRIRMLSALRRKGALRSGSFLSVVGCGPRELRAHLEALFQPGMTWENHGLHGWHIDHIQPCASFDLTDPAQQRACFHYTNLQPLWATDNLRKKDKWLTTRASSITVAPHECDLVPSAGDGG